MQRQVLWNDCAPELKYDNISCDEIIGLIGIYSIAGGRVVYEGPSKAPKVRSSVLEKVFALVLPGIWNLSTKSVAAHGNQVGHRRYP